MIDTQLSSFDFRLRSEKTHLLGPIALVARRQHLEAVRGGPLFAGAIPAEARHNRAIARVELHALCFKQLALGQTARADPAILADDPLPGHTCATLGDLIQRIANRARIAAAADDRRDIAVARDPAVRDLLA